MGDKKKMELLIEEPRTKGVVLYLKKNYYGHVAVNVRYAGSPPNSDDATICWVTTEGLLNLCSHDGVELGAFGFKLDSEDRIQIL